MKVKNFLQDITLFRDTSFESAPEVSILMTTYCRGDHLLSQAIDSILAQTFTNFELIIVDDGSRDTTLDVLKAYQQQDFRITVLRHEYNSGLPALRLNEALLLARGKYIAYQFDDDTYLPTAIQDLYTAITQSPVPCAVYGSCELTITRPNGTVEQRLLGATPFNYGLLNNENYIANNAIMHPRHLIETIGLYDCNLFIRRFSDYDLWLRMAKQVPFHWIGTTVSRVCAGTRHALGVDVPITNLSLIRRYLEIDRTAKLLPHTVSEYAVDGLAQYTEQFTPAEIDAIKRIEVIPFLSKTSYLMSMEEKFTYAISRPQTQRVAVIKSDYSTSVDVTIKNYLTRIPHFPYHYFFFKEAWVSTLTSEDFDMAILHRTTAQSTSQFLLHNQSHHKPTAYFMDDNMFKFYELGPTFNYLAPTSPGYQHVTKQVHQADLVATYNPIITADCKQHNTHIHQIKTNIPLTYLKKKQYFPRGTAKIRFGIFSGPVRLSETQFLWEVLEKIALRYKDHIIFEFWGIDPSTFGTLACEVHYRPFTYSYEQYMDALQSNRFDFQICPLMGLLDASKSKSPIKFLEGAVCGSIGIFSDVMPYDQIPDALCLKTANTLDQWYQTLEKAIEMPEETRYAIYQASLDYLIQNYSSQAQVFDFLGTLEATQLHHHLQKKRIAYMFHESYLGGATLHLFRHALMAQSMGFEVLLCLGENQRSIDALPLFVKPYGFDIHYLPYRIFATPTNFTAQNHQDAQQIADWITQHNVGLIHEATFVPTLGLAAKYAHIPNVASLHQYLPDLTHTFTKEAANIQMIHSSSNRYAQDWGNAVGCHAQRIVCPVEKAFFALYPSNTLTAQTQFAPDLPLRILVSGTLQPRKNQLEAIRAIKYLRDKGYNLRLDLIGYDTLRSDYLTLCQNEITQHHLEDVVTIHGFSYTPETYYDHCAQVLLCSSTDESMPQTILQAMAAGLFVVTAPVGGVYEIIKDNYSGMIATGTSYLELAEALERLLLFSPEHRMALLSNAYETIRILGSYDFVRSELLLLYNRAFAAL